MNKNTLFFYISSTDAKKSYRVSAASIQFAWMEWKDCINFLSFVSSFNLFFPPWGLLKFYRADTCVCLQLTKRKTQGWISSRFLYKDFLPEEFLLGTVLILKNIFFLQSTFSHLLKIAAPYQQHETQFRSYLKFLLSPMY